ncbi:uncharacterized protein FA14DRAFT_156663 [Meira miltonrushii]|uniref:Uncharacterized protein n=1 Tax=Meira miltonrushii TaxID=1280837 RepID=A0A316VA99_9BASI|nr:uncharacterized protein FA14DRAFT_156663 [Meira miltonrushii]PWN33988.1 hypothetical protein FA14DRAFT_156663 [Meira miltonrushii]
MKSIIALFFLLAVLCTSTFATPMEKPPKDLKFDVPDNSDNPFPEPQLLPYNTSDCSFPTDPQTRMLEQCLTVCLLDPTCQTLGFNRTEIGCACPAQYCPDGKLYGFPAYTKGEPLTPEKIAKQPHVKAPCFGCVGSQVSPNGTQIGDCSSRCSSTTKIYHPNQDPASSNPNLDPSVSRSNQGGSGSDSDPKTVTYKPDDYAPTCLNPAISEGGKSNN